MPDTLATGINRIALGLGAASSPAEAAGYNA